ncbi:MAG: CBS domain-containing protein [Deltaproteobacteria bacterium]|nr:CBS domain-containing protein [Deltaproteobacteria bacterium]
MPSRLKKILETNKIQQVKLRSPVLIPPGTQLTQVLNLMQAKKRGCAIIESKGHIIGIFTERDLLTRVVEPQKPLTTKIDDVMTPNPVSLKLTSSIAEAVLLMSKKGYRHVPLLDDEGIIKGFVSVRDILDYLAEHFPYEVYNQPPDPNQISRSAEGA